LKRLPKRGVFERQRIYEILDEGFVCHLGFSINQRPFVIPTAYGRLDDALFIHGSAASRTLRALAGGIEVCVTVTLVDGLVLARSAFHHSMNYRSVMVFGTASVVEDREEKTRALRAFSDHVLPQRWNDVREPNESELRKTLVLRLPLEEASAKVRSGPPLDDGDDYLLPTWAGEVPLKVVAQIPVADPRLSPSSHLPVYLKTFVERTQANYRTQIRLAKIDEASAISHLLEAAFTEYHSLYTREGYNATAITTGEVAKRMSEGPMWVAVLDDQIVGTVAAVAKNESLYIRGMAIVPEARGKRIGEELLRHVEKFAVDEGYKSLTLSTTPFLNRAIRLYEGFGFERINAETTDLFGTPLFSMYKKLTTSSSVQMCA
jgi:nitroimidazol reductase NimA-like FMN-containing flavoprotein (pyridoxamine 5'-phosphate oxidase superfamily)/ribosomal protein S18 acetylase RimI-like enzyme